MPFIKSNPDETKKKLDILAQTEEGTRASQDFDQLYDKNKNINSGDISENLTQTTNKERSCIKWQ